MRPAPVRASQNGKKTLTSFSLRHLLPRKGSKPNGRDSAPPRCGDQKCGGSGRSLRARSGPPGADAPATQHLRMRPSIQTTAR